LKARTLPWLAGYIMGVQRLTPLLKQHFAFSFAFCVFFTRACLSLETCPLTVYAANARALTAFLRGCRGQLAPALFLAVAEAAHAAADGSSLGREAADGAAERPAAGRGVSGDTSGAGGAALHRIRTALDRGEPVRCGHLQ